MPKDEQNAKESAGIARRGGKALAWGTIGEIVGRFVAIYVPDTPVNDEMLAHGVAALFGLLGALDLSVVSSLFSKGEADPAQKLRRCLHNADKMFADGLISHQEMMDMRKSCLKKHKQEIEGV